MAKEAGGIRAILRWAVERNCLYLISVFCLLLGVCSYMSSNGSESLSGELGMLGVFTSYEFLLIAVAWGVYRRFRLGHDGLMLTCIAVLLLYDPTFFNNVFYARGLSVGLVVNGVCFLLALGKLALLVGPVGAPIHRRVALMIVLAAVVVFFMPALFVDRSPTFRRLALSWLWWLLPVLVLAGPRPSRRGVDRHGVPTDEDALRKFPFVLFSLPLVAFFVHFWQMTKVYDLAVADFTWAPVLVAFTVIAVRCHRDFFLERRWLLHGAMGLTVLLGAGAASGWNLHLGGLIMSPWRAGLLAGAAFSAALWNAWGTRDLVAASVLQGALFMAGPRPDSLLLAIEQGDPAVMAFLLAALLWACRTWRHPLLLGGLVAAATAGGARILGLGDPMAIFLASQLGGLAAIVFEERRSGSLTEAWQVLPGLVFFGACVFAAEAPGATGSLAWVWAHVEGILFTGAALLRKNSSYVVAPAMVGGLRWGPAVMETAVRHRGSCLLVMAFGTLAGGFLLSARKEQILGALADEAEIEVVPGDEGLASDGVSS